MKSPVTLFLLSLALLLSSCSEKKEAIPAPDNLYSDWNLQQVLANDHWGGPLYWRPAKGDVSITFSADHKYYRKYASDSFYTLIGSYLVLNDSTVQITQVNPPNPAVPTIKLRFTFEAGGFLVIHYNMFEGVVKEKFLLQNANPSPRP